MHDVDLHINGQTRELRVTASGLLRFKSWMPGNIGMREALAFHRDQGVISIALATMLRHKGPGGDENITPYKTAKWLDEENGRYLEIEAAVMRAARAYWRAAGVLEDDDEGEEKAAPTKTAAPPSTTGTDSSSSPAGTPLIPGSSTS